MYNMDISLFGFKLNVEILILMGVIYLILVGHTLCGCSNYGLMEGLETIGQVAAAVSSVDMSNNKIATNSANSNTNMLTQTSTAPNLGAAGAMVSAKKEGFVGAKTTLGNSSPYDLTNNSSNINTSSWSKSDMNVVPGQPLSQGVKNFLARKPQTLPLPKDEMLMFANTEFKPECCPNTYSTGSGCACMTGSQYNYLTLRGGNNAPYSEF